MRDTVYLGPAGRRKGFERARARAPVAVSLAALCAGMIWSSSAYAQTSPPPVPSAPTGHDRFLADARASVTYDSNVSGGNQAVANARQLRPEDLIYSVGASATFQLPSSRHTFFLTGAVDVQRYEHNTALDGENYLVAAGGSERIGICQTTATAAYSRRTSLVEDLVLPVVHNVTEQPSANISLACGRGAVFGAVSGTVSQLKNDATSAGYVDSVTENATAAVGYHNSVLGDVSLVGLYSLVNYDHPPTVTAPGILALPQPDVREWGVGLQFGRKLGLRLSGNALISWQHLEVEGNGAPLNPIQVSNSSDSLAATASLAYRVSPKLGLTLAYSLGNQASPVVNAQYVRHEELHFDASYKLSQRMGLHASVGKSSDDYRGGIVSLLQIRQSNELDYGAGLSLNLGRKISLNLDASHRRRRADLPIFDFESDRVSLGLVGRY